MQADEATRVRQGASVTTSPELLWELARDTSVTVRASLALNPALPAPISAILEADADPRVRTILSRKRARLSAALTQPAPTNPDRQRTQQDAIASLTALIADAALRVRANIAEAVRDLADGPRDIVLRLAHDPAVLVCGPVIRFSPMLTRDDLMTLITSGPPQTTIMAVANRPAIDALVSDAIVATTDPEAIGALLANQTAQIRDPTLDALAAQSEEQTGWQKPLVHRPHLPVLAQRMLGEIVTGQLLEALAGRPDLDPKVGQSLRLALLQGQAGFRTQEQTPRSRDTAKSRANGTPVPPVDPATHAALAQAQAMKQTGELDDYMILDALRRNELMAASVMVSVKADVPLSVIERACDLRSAKAITSIAWKASMSPQTAVVLQAMLARLSPDLILRPGPNGEWPLSEDAMRGQLNALGAGEVAKHTWMPRRLS